MDNIGDKIQAYLLNVIIKTGGPSAIRQGIGVWIAYLAVNNNLLLQYGVNTVGHITTIDWSVAGVKLIALLPLIAGAIKIGQAHTSAIVTGVPVTGDQRETPTIPSPGGERKDDPPQGDQK